MFDPADMRRKMREDARLIILKALSDMQPDETLSSKYLHEAVRAFGGIRCDRDWVHDELRWLADRAAITLRAAGSVMIATLAEKGSQHLIREIAIEGVTRPSRSGA